MLANLVLKPSHRNFQKLILPFRLDHLLSHKALISFQAVPLKPQVLYFGHQVLLDLHLLDRVVQLMFELVFETPDYFSFYR